MSALLLYILAVVVSFIVLLLIMTAIGVIRLRRGGR